MVAEPFVAAHSAHASDSVGHHIIHIFGKPIVMDVPVSAVILSLIGAIALGKLVVSILVFLAETFLFTGESLKTFGAKQNRWAVITGCTSGIGEAFAKQLARAGFNVCLIGRNVESLRKLEQEISAKSPLVQTTVIPIDLSHPTPETFSAYSKWIAQPEVQVGVLVNNAGVSHSMPVSFAETTLEEMDNILQVNIHATLLLTRLTLPHLLTKKSTPGPKVKSLILNIGSFGGTVPSPLLATYSASKAFLATWNKALGEEVKKDGVVVRLVLPGFVVSKMSKIRRPSMMVPTPQTFVSSTLKSIGLNRGAQSRVYESTPYWTHAAMDYIVGFVPESITVWYNLRLHKDIRARALKKQQRDKLKSQ
ncbi:putative 3-ketoacyl-CoA reductase [Filobasidium floriforme]|uniref:putative 3-ketoacyl-CoA reductase n=1 Tax=Filobasidium floriforme TaxID=5210 RepID=UPI001E8E30B3|nr:putative 3-ketoacyl-CoA reductase [Filobasidium floriforme]KAH8081421.1 putative 3-ketoacyl-CoA reductase [Filobasidium floriforme]